MYTALYRQQPYYATQLIVNYLPKAYFFISGAVLGFCGVLLSIVTVQENLPNKIHGLAAILFITGFYLSKSSFKTVKRSS